MLRGATGFGSSLLLAPFLSHLIGPFEAVALSLLLGSAATAFLAPSQIAHVNLPTIGLVGGAGLVCTLPGILLLRSLDPELMRRVIALATMGAAALMLLAPRLRLPSSRFSSVIAGAIGGIVMGATSVGGPPFVLYLVGRSGPTAQKMANIVFVVGAVELTALTLLLISGALKSGILFIALAMLPLFFVGIAVGRKVFFAAGDRYRDLVLFALIATGLILVVI